MASETINDRLKRVRKELNLSQKTFCTGILLTPGHYAGIELNQRAVNDRIIKLITTIYHVNENFLRTGEGAVFDEIPDQKLQQLIRIFQGLPEDYKDYILQQIEQLKKLHNKTSVKDHHRG
jgi:transcriptional regulator with XRE-family HTH domain